MVDKKSQKIGNPLPILGDVQKNLIIHNVLDKCLFRCLYCTKRITWMPQNVYQHSKAWKCLSPVHQIKLQRKLWTRSSNNGLILAIALWCRRIELGVLLDALAAASSHTAGVWITWDGGMWLDWPSAKTMWISSMVLCVFVMFENFVIKYYCSGADSHNMIIALLRLMCIQK